MQQMADLQKGYSGSNMVVAHAKERGAHDDYPDSYALAVYGAKSAGETTKIETTKNPMIHSGSQTNYYKGRNRMTAKRR